MNRILACALGLLVVGAAGQRALGEQPGYTVTGTVIGPRGEPVEGATVICRGAEEPVNELRTRTGPDGRFRFEGRPPGLRRSGPRPPAWRWA